MTASPIEWVWLAVAGVGWIVKMFLLASARANYRHYRHSPVVAQAFISRSVYVHMAHMMVTFTICVMAAIWGVTHEPPPPPIIQTQSFVIALFFLSVTVALTVHAVLVARWWNKLEEGFNGTDHPSQNPPPKSVVTIETTISAPTEPAIRAMNRFDNQDHG